MTDPETRRGIAPADAGAEAPEDQGVDALVLTIGLSFAFLILTAVLLLACC